MVQILGAGDKVELPHQASAQSPGRRWGRARGFSHCSSAAFPLALQTDAMGRGVKARGAAQSLHISRHHGSAELRAPFAKPGPFPGLPEALGPSGCQVERNHPPGIAEKPPKDRRRHGQAL